MLGAYQAFGHGVNYEETYSARLRAELLRSPRLRRLGITPVVWNAGLQSAQINRGIRYLEENLQKLRPDLVILDYGMTDQMSKGLNPWLRIFSHMVPPQSEFYRRFDYFIRRATVSPLGKTYLFTSLMNKAVEGNMGVNREIWAEQTKRTLRLLEKKKIRALLLDQPVAGIPVEIYREIIKPFPLAEFFSVKELLEESARTDPGAKPKWLEEFPLAYRVFYCGRVKFCSYLGDILQIGARAHAILGRALAKQLEGSSNFFGDV